MGKNRPRANSRPKLTQLPQPTNALPMLVAVINQKSLVEMLKPTWPKLPELAARRRMLAEICCKQAVATAGKPASPAKCVEKPKSAGAAVLMSAFAAASAALLM